MHSDFDILILKNTRTYYSQVLKHLMRTQIFVGSDMEKNAPKNLENVVGDFFV